MRIALYHNAPSGGAKRAIYEWTRRLAATHTVDCYTLSTADHDFCDIRPLVQRTILWEFQPAPLFESPWGRLNQARRWRDLSRLERLNRQIAAEIDSNDYDVVFAHTCRFTLIPSVMRYLKTPNVYYLHEAVGSRLQRPISRPYARPRGWRGVADRVDPLIRLHYGTLYAGQRKSAESAQRLLANSAFTQAQMAAAYKLLAPVCHYGVATDVFRPLNESAEDEFVFSVGEMSARKGFDFLIESLARIPPARRPSLRLACNRIEPPEYDFVIALAERYGVTLEILQNLTAEELAIQHNRARFCVYAPVLEPFGLVPLEAMACGKAVVGVGEGGVKESVVHGVTGLLTDRDPGQFAEAVQYLLNNPAIAEQFGRQGREQVLSCWSWEESTAQVVNHLQAAARGDAAPVTVPQFELLAATATGLRTGE